MFCFDHSDPSTFPLLLIWENVFLLSSLDKTLEEKQLFLLESTCHPQNRESEVGKVSFKCVISLSPCRQRSSSRIHKRYPDRYYNTKLCWNDREPIGLCTSSIFILFVHINKVTNFLGIISPADIRNNIIRVPEYFIAIVYCNNWEITDFNCSTEV